MDTSRARDSKPGNDGQQSLSARKDFGISGWLENRDHAEVFAEELEQAVKVVAMLPGAGTAYASSPIPGVCRVYPRRVALHLYYTFDDDVVVIRALWGARRERGPRLEP